MKKIMQTMLFITLMIVMGSAKPNSDTVIPSRIILSNTLGKITNNIMAPGKPVEIITSKDEIIYYSADISVINPTKKKYNFKIVCFDSKNNIIFSDIVQETLYKKKSYIGTDVVKHILLYLRLDPEPGAIVEGRLLPWEDNKDYFIKLYFEKKLIGITKFHYLIEK